MSLGLAFWIILLLWLVLGLIAPYWGPWPLWPSHILLLILLLLIGWKVFGPPLHG